MPFQCGRQERRHSRSSRKASLPIDALAAHVVLRPNATCIFQSLLLPTQGTTVQKPIGPTGPPHRVTKVFAAGYSGQFYLKVYQLLLSMKVTPICFSSVQEGACCSPTVVTFHYVPAAQMEVLEFLIYGLQLVSRPGVNVTWPAPLGPDPAIK